jgi:hypothetical protein
LKALRKYFEGAAVIEPEVCETGYQPARARHRVNRTSSTCDQSQCVDRLLFNRQNAKRQEIQNSRKQMRNHNHLFQMFTYSHLYFGVLASRFLRSLLNDRAGSRTLSTRRLSRREVLRAYADGSAEACPPADARSRQWMPPATGALRDFSTIAPTCRCSRRKSASAAGRHRQSDARSWPGRATSGLRR